MAKELASDLIMPAAKMKPLLLLSKREPVQVAIALSSESDGVILLDKKMKPSKVAATLKATAGKAKLQLNPSTVRFGRAEVDPDYDPAMVRFFVNKEAPGAMRAKLVEVLKRAGFQKAEINVDPSVGDESEDDEAEQAAEAAPSGTGPALDADALRKQLSALVQQIPQALTADPSRKAKLLELATQAQQQLRSDDLKAAAATIGALEAAMEAPVTAATSPGTHAADPAVYAKVQTAWLQMRGHLESDVQTLRESLLAAYDGTPLLGDVDRSYAARTAPLLNALDGRLADLLRDAAATTDPQQQHDLVQQARATIGEYQSYIQSEPLLRDLGDNPFVKLATPSALTRGLDTLLAALH